MIMDCKKIREDIIAKVKLKGKEFEKEIIHKIETEIIQDWYELELVL